MKQKTLPLVALVLLLSALIVPFSVSAIETADIEDGYEPVWSGDLNITVYLPETTATSALQPQGLDILQNKFENHAQRTVKVWEDPTHPGMIAVTLVLDFTTERNAVSFAEALKNPNKLNKLNLKATSNLTESTYDIIPDERAVDQGDANLWDQTGTVTTHYTNGTDIDTTTSYLVELADYNYSIANWIKMTDFQLNSAANATVIVQYVNSTGLAATNKTIVNTDYYITAEDVYFKLPTPPTTATYVSKLYFDDVSLTSFSLVRFSADFEDSPTFDFSETAASLSPNALFTGFSTKIVNSLKTAKVPIRTEKSTLLGVGYRNVKDVALNAAATALGIKRSEIQDHKLNSGKEQVTFPSKLTSIVYSGMKKAYESGQKNPQALARDARKNLKAITLSVGVKAASLRSSAVSYAKEMGPKVIGAIAERGEKAVTALGKSGNSVWDKMKDSAGRLPELPSSLIAKLSPDFFKGLKSNLKWIILAIALVAGAMVLIRSKNMR